MTGMLDTDALIDRLAAEATPVDRLRPLWQRAALWFALGLPPLLLVVAVHGVAADIPALLADREVVIEQAATLLTAAAAAFAALGSTVPGRSRRWLWLPVLPLAVWLLCIGESCADSWIRFGAEGLALDTGCLIPMVLIGVVPLAAMLAMLRRGAPLSPRITLLLGALAVSAMVNFGLRFMHVGDLSLLVLAWHFVWAAVLWGLAWAAGPRLLGWARRPAA